MKLDRHRRVRTSTHWEGWRTGRGTPDRKRATTRGTTTGRTDANTS